jgi:5,10-methenyltetrahydrofolate synthetase
MRPLLKITSVLGELSHCFSLPTTGSLVVGIYWPLPGEPNWQLLQLPADLNVAWPNPLSKVKVTLVLPKVSPQAKTLNWVTVPQACWQHPQSLILEKPLEQHKGFKHLQEIALTQEQTLYTGALDLVFIPALAMDAEGYRLGYGGGYYDRWLASVPTALMPKTIGVTWASTCVPQLPVDPWDVPLNALLTEEGLSFY